jgi:hypothetical protein
MPSPGTVKTPPTTASRKLRSPRRAGASHQAVDLRLGLYDGAHVMMVSDGQTARRRRAAEFGQAFGELRRFGVGG